MNYHAAADYAVRAGQAEPAHLDALACLTVGICPQVDHVATMSLAASIVAMCLAGWIEVSLGAAGVRRTAIANFMYMKTMLAGCQTGNLRFDPEITVGFAKTNIARDCAARTGDQFGTGRWPADGGGAGTEQNSGERARGKDETGFHGFLP